MEEVSSTGPYEPISAQSFGDACAIFPELREIREEEKASSNDRFEFFLSLFQKLRQINPPFTSEQRYEYLFNIIEMGNCLDSMVSSKKDHMFFEVIGDYRNIVADGFHAYSPETSDDVIQTFSNFLKTMHESKDREIFTDSFQRAAR